MTPAAQLQGERVEMAPNADQDATADVEAASRAGVARPPTRSVASVRRQVGDGRLHIVRPGESLWTIAEGLLEPGASATNIAAEVARLWELNRDRIPSGDPDLIEVGQQLKLR